MVDKPDTTTETYKGINEAFVAAQKLIGGARKTSTNPFFKAKYADLKECFNACSDILNDHGIHISQPTMREGDLFVIRTILTHSSGETMQDLGVPIVGWQSASNPMQAFGSGQTYARRYGLCGMVGIAPEDDDGNSLSKDAPKKNPPGITKLKTELTEFYRDMKACSDPDSLTALSASSTEFLEKLKKDYPDGWLGDGGDIKGLLNDMKSTMESLREDQTKKDLK